MILATLAIGTGAWPPLEPTRPIPSTVTAASPSRGQAGLNRLPGSFAVFGSTRWTAR